MKNTTLNLLIFIAVSLSSIGMSFGQSTEEKEIKLYYRSDLSGGVFMHSHGYGASFRYGQYLTGFSKRLFYVEMLNMKHPKEYKSFNPYFNDAKGYYYGKQNSLTILRPGIGREQTITGKELNKSVKVSYVYSYGPSFGFIKPIFLEVAYSKIDNRPTSVASRNYDIETEVFNADLHDPDNIIGRAPFTTGLGDLGMAWGGHARFALNFEYAPEDEMLKALEVGATLDVFDREVPIMESSENTQYFLSFYVSLWFGKKNL